MKNRFYILIFSIIIAGFTLNSLYAQSNFRIIREFNELKIYLAKIQVVVQKFDNPKANNFMTQAKQELNLAENSIYNDRNVIQARIHMQKARAFGNQAAKMVLAQPINRLKKQLDDMINMSEINSSNLYSDEARYLLNQAKKFRKLAYDALAAGRTNKAQEFYRIAFYFADKSLNLANINENDMDTQIAEIKSSIDLLINQVEELIASDKNNRFNNLLIEAKKHYADALNLLDTGRINLALKRFRLIEKLLYRIIDQADRSSLNQKDRLENDLYSMQSFLNALEEDAEENQNQRVNMILNRAKKQYLEATRAYETGNYDLAKNKLNLSQRFASKALQLLKTQSNEEDLDIESQISDNKKLLDLQQSKVEESKNIQLLKMHQEAQRLTNKAEELCNQNNKIPAIQHLQLSTRLMNRIQRQLEYTDTENTVQTKELKNRLNRAQMLLTKLKNNKNLNAEYQNEVQQLDILYMEAEKQYENQDYEIANEYINYILQQINMQSNEWSKQTK
jgi:HEPN domain-containing protein